MPLKGLFYIVCGTVKTLTGFLEEGIPFDIANVRTLCILRLNQINPTL